jgi:hypothetical protein
VDRSGRAPRTVPDPWPQVLAGRDDATLRLTQKRRTFRSGALLHFQGLALVVQGYRLLSKRPFRFESEQLHQQG